jgi:hypothetical protein
MGRIGRRKGGREGGRKEGRKEERKDGWFHATNYTASHV